MDRQIASQLLAGGFRRGSTHQRETSHIKADPEPGYHASTHLYGRQPSTPYYGVHSIPRQVNSMRLPSMNAFVKPEAPLGWSSSAHSGVPRNQGTGNTEDPITLSDSDEDLPEAHQLNANNIHSQPCTNRVVEQNIRSHNVRQSIRPQNVRPPRNSSRNVDDALQGHMSNDILNDPPRFELPEPDNPDDYVFQGDNDGQNNTGQANLNDNDEAQIEQTRHDMRSLMNLPPLEIPKAERMDTPAALKCRLFEHQKVALTWLVRQEQNPSKRGGLLADGMGLGKTIEALALILANPPTPNAKYKTTLIIAPVALLQQWKREIRDKVKPDAALKVWVLHGAKTRDMSWHRIRDYDVVLCTYGKLAAEYKTRTTLHRVDHLALLHPRAKFHRVILDESQVIKSKVAKASLAAAGLHSKHRLCMTGTPFMNRTVEIFPIIRFLNIAPYNKWETFSELIDRPLLRWDGEPRDDAMRHLQTFFRSCSLRRTKNSKLDGQPLFRLPSRVDYTIKVTLDKEQRALYDALASKTMIQINKYLRSGTFGNKYNIVLVLTLRLRQCAVHPFLIRDLGLPEGTTLCNEGMWIVASEVAPDIVARIKAMDEFICPVCQEVVVNPMIIAPCGHHVCGTCFTNIMASRAEFTEDGVAARAYCPDEFCNVEIQADMVALYSIFAEAHGKAGEPSLVQARQQDHDIEILDGLPAIDFDEDDVDEELYGFQDQYSDQDDSEQEDAPDSAPAARSQSHAAEPVDPHLGDDNYAATSEPLTDTSFESEDEGEGGGDDPAGSSPAPSGTHSMPEYGPQGRNLPQEARDSLELYGPRSAKEALQLENEELQHTEEVTQVDHEKAMRYTTHPFNRLFGTPTSGEMERERERLVTVEAQSQAAAEAAMQLDNVNGQGSPTCFRRSKSSGLFVTPSPEELARESIAALQAQRYAAANRAMQMDNEDGRSSPSGFRLPPDSEELKRQRPAGIQARRKARVGNNSANHPSSVQQKNHSTRKYAAITVKVKTVKVEGSSDGTENGNAVETFAAVPSNIESNMQGAPSSVGLLVSDSLPLTARGSPMFVPQDQDAPTQNSNRNASPSAQSEDNGAKDQTSNMISSYDGPSTPPPSGLSAYQRRLNQSRRRLVDDDDDEYDGIDPLVSSRPNNDDRIRKRQASPDGNDSRGYSFLKKRMRRTTFAPNPTMQDNDAYSMDQDRQNTVAQENYNSPIYSFKPMPRGNHANPIRRAWGERTFIRELSANTPLNTIERDDSVQDTAQDQRRRNHDIASRLLNPKAPVRESAEPQVITIESESEQESSPDPIPRTIGQLRRAARKNLGALHAYRQRIRRDWVSSAKVDKIMELLKDITLRRPREKILIFSLWTSFLDLMAIPVEDARIGFTRYDGYMKPDNRDAAVRVFMEDPKIQVMLISLTAGNAGLNLTAAQHVIIVEPFWNPYTEEQAIDRAHRIGQTKRVCVYRMIVPDTIEERIQELQRVKRRLVDAALSEEGANRAGRLSMDDLMALFGL